MNQHINVIDHITIDVNQQHSPRAQVMGSEETVSMGTIRSWYRKPLNRDLIT